MGRGGDPVKRTKDEKKIEKNLKYVNVQFLSLLAKNSQKNNEKFFFFSVQRLHHYWKVLAGRVGKYTVENDFSESQCSQWK